MDATPPLATADDLAHAIEALFPYSGEFNRPVIRLPWRVQITSNTLALKSRKPHPERRLLAAMFEHFARAKRTLGNRDDVGIMWRRHPYFVTEDDGTVILRLRMALVDDDGQINVSGLPLKHEGTSSQSID